MQKEGYINVNDYLWILSKYYEECGETCLLYILTSQQVLHTFPQESTCLFYVCQGLEVAPERWKTPTKWVFIPGFYFFL